MGKKRRPCRILVGKPEGKRSLGRTWTQQNKKNRITMDLGEKGWVIRTVFMLLTLEISSEFLRTPYQISVP
jgi:hypothetical protein